MTSMVFQQKRCTAPGPASSDSTLMWQVPWWEEAEAEQQARKGRRRREKRGWWRRLDVSDRPIAYT